MESNQQKQKWFYLWQNRIVLPDDKIVTRTCFGITGRLNDPGGRRNGYEGHVGHLVEFKDLWYGPARPIQDLERRIKEAFFDNLLVGHNGFRYEWITEDIDYLQIKGWVEWETNNHPSISKVTG